MEVLALIMLAAAAFFSTQSPPPPPAEPAIAVAAPAVAAPDRVILMASADGKVGAVEVRSVAQPGQVVVLNAAGASVGVDAAGTLQVAPVPDSGVQGRYAALLAMRPKSPVSFTVYFETGSSTELAAGSRPVLDQLRASLAEYPAPEITVVGHTDRVGSVAFNDQLSLQRAQTLRRFLEDLGIRALRMDVAGRGEREPLVPTADEVPEPRNRRVEIRVR